MGVLFFDFPFISGFLENVNVECHLFSSPVQLMCSQGMPPGIVFWIIVMSWDKEFWKPDRNLTELLFFFQEGIFGFYFILLFFVYFLFF